MATFELRLAGPGVRAESRRLEKSPFVVGRESSADLVIPEAWVSRRQLVFEREGEGWTVRPEGRNPMTLDGAPLLEPVAIRGGQRIQLGPAVLEIEALSLALEDGELQAPTIELAVADVDRGRTSPVRALAEAAQRFAALDREAIAAAAAEQALASVGARSAAVVRFTGAKADILGSAGVELGRISRRVLEWATERQRTVCIDDAGATPLSEQSSSVVLSTLGPIAVAPAGVRPGLLLYVERALGDRGFGLEDAAFLAVLGQIVGSAFLAAERVAELEESKKKLDEERRQLRRDIERRGRFGALIGSSAPMQKVAGLITRVAPTDATVLIHGETGSGKELVAREVHRRSKRAEAPFFALNCAAMPETLIESELFGHRKGAFSGADRDRRGIFDLAQGGTVFLDEIGELPLTAQAKVLRALDAKEILPLGGGMPVKIDVRLVAATHRDLAQEVADGRFRQDLLFRLKVFPITLSPLRDRKEDLVPLVEAFLEASADAQQKKVRAMSKAALEALGRYEFPGNVRELMHLIAHAVILADEGETLDVRHLPDEVVRTSPRRPSGAKNRASLPPSADGLNYPPVTTLREMIGELEREVIIRELGKDGWNRTRSAKRLDVSLRAFMDKLKRYDIREE